MRPMSDTQHVHSSFRSSDKIEDAFKRMKVNENESNPYPDRPGERDCQFYLRTGLCGYGSTCRYNHPTHLPQGIIYQKEELPERFGQPDCEYFLKTGACKYGATCKYHHPKDRNGAEPVLFNVIGLPMRQGEKPCPYYLRTGTCRFGVACKFHHPHPDNGHSTAYGMFSFPSSGLHYGGGLTMMSLPPATYGTMPRPQVPQSYVPVMVSPSQGLLPPQAWATYMAASNPIYNVKNQPYYSTSSASLPMAVALNHGLPEKSEQPECRFFMSTGTCKYGDDCKYNHPGVRVSPPPPNLLNPFVLPARPGQPACGNFKSYGFCKFGPNCKFDHPMLPYPSLTMPPSLQTPYARPVSSTHQRISPSPSHSDSKPLSNGKPAVKKESSETKDSEQLKNSGIQDLSANSTSP
ncbi:unnamed protein product [Arabis nemorensis]|uniref:C3H1-type domain-containing protein n=1 Tax=Arabis nemorensis TaxID=586526 RepID=A0A565AKU8_9BRAS|nr:unnamed protein product [Arabis nemorensis]